MRRIFPLFGNPTIPLTTARVPRGSALPILRPPIAARSIRSAVSLFWDIVRRIVSSLRRYPQQIAKGCPKGCDGYVYAFAVDFPQQAAGAHQSFPFLSSAIDPIYFANHGFPLSAKRPYRAAIVQASAWLEGTARGWSWGS